MKRFKFIFFTLTVLLCFHSCKDKPYPKILALADSLCCTNPDSAIVLLNKNKAEILAEPTATQMYYKLLCIKANDKAYITHTSDSVILQILSFYESKEGNKHLPEAYYYGGRVYSDLGDAPQALDYFQKALDVTDGGKEYRLRGRIYSQMGTLYLYQDIYDEGLKAYKKAHYYDSLTQSKTCLILSLRDIGLAYTAANKADSALFYYQEAYEKANKQKHQNLTKVIQEDLASLYIQLKQYNAAKNTLLITGNYQKPSAVYSILAKLYYSSFGFRLTSYL